MRRATGYIPAAMKNVCFECGERGHFGRDCPVRKANDGRRGKAPKRVRFDPAADDDDDDDDDDPLRRRRRRGGLKAEDDDDDDDDDESKRIIITRVPK